MATDESIFLQLDDDPEQVAEWLVGVLPFERLSSGQDEVVLRGAAETVDGWLRVTVSRNIYVSPDSGADEAQAIDAYPIEIGIRYKPDEVLRQEARLTFEKLVAARPEVAMLLVHEVTILDAAHLPGVGTQYFEEPVTVDAPDQDKWRDWVRELTTGYAITPLGEPDWVVGAEELAAGIADRWPGARVRLAAFEGSSMGLEALIPLVPSPRELGVTLSGTGQAVTLEPADAEAAAEFAVWYFERFLAGRTGVHLIEPATMRTVELTEELTPEMLFERIK